MKPWWSIPRCQIMMTRRVIYGLSEGSMDFFYFPLMIWNTSLLGIMFILQLLSRDEICELLVYISWIFYIYCIYMLWTYWFYETLRKYFKLPDYGDKDNHIWFKWRKHEHFLFFVSYLKYILIWNDVYFITIE
jgi:hypothetical protein